VITAGPRYAQVLDVRRRKLGSALRQIVNATDRSTLVMARQAAVLLPLLDEWAKAWIENGIDDCGYDCGLPLSFEEFHDLVQESADRQPRACARLREVAPLIFRHFPKARGASLKTATVTHALLLMVTHGAGHHAAYTYCPYKDDFIDRMTAATRRQLQQPRFIPIGARRLLKRLKWTEG
jgi:hypothetical protein